MALRSGVLLRSVIAGAALLIASGAKSDQTYPDAVTASPDVYKVIAESGDLRMVMATWKPGQRDAMHRHPALVSYSVTNCEKMRVFFPDGTSVAWSRPVGNPGQQEPTVHSIANEGDAVCQNLFVEHKP